jgi:hypothetical protein
MREQRNDQRAGHSGAGQEEVVEVVGRHIGSFAACPTAARETRVVV